MQKVIDSGVPWIGCIPSDWECKKGKYILKYVQKPVKPDDGVITCFRDGQVTLRSNRREDGFTMADKEIGYQGIDIGDLVVHGMDGFAGAIGVSDSRGKASPVLNVLDTEMNKRYVMYYLRSVAYGNVFLALATGIRVRSCDLRWNKLAELLYPVPPIGAQDRIVKYLDRKCSKIDGLRANIQSEIDTLEEYRQSIIAESVTHGLNEKVALKNSGVAWCPKIPKHWTVVNPKGLFSLRTERAFPGDKQLTASQEHGVVFQDEYMELTGNRIVTVLKDFSILKHVEPNDFVISMRSFQGGLEYSENRGCISSAYVMLVPNEKYVYAPFYRWFFKSSKYINALQSTSNLVRDGQAMRYANFVQIPLFIIPKEEQIAIAHYLDNRVGKIDRVLSVKKDQLKVLEEYKRSIIYECVTGKREVPNEA